MKRTGFNLVPVLAILLFSSCQSKTVRLLSKKWDCVKVENINMTNGGFQNPEDSVSSAQLKTVLESLSWTFNNTWEYECAVAGKVTIRGNYGLTEDEKVLICTPSTKNTVNRYAIDLLTENDLVLSSSANSTPLILYFKPH